MERIETPLWNKVALREAVINAIVHNDYSFEVPPKFEIFPDRLEITSAGRLPESLTREEFFNGISIPRNKELMRIYRDVELVESLGSGIPRILRAYGEDCFKFTDNFIRITLPIRAYARVSGGVSGGVSEGVSEGVISNIEGMTDAVKEELLNILKLFKDDEGMKLKDIASNRERPVKTIERYVKILKDLSLLEFRGAPRNGKYYRK